MKKGLNNNQLKLIAMITMTVDHVGLMLLPQYPLLRVIGRLAFPIYAYMIAEGCTYTRSMPKYLGIMAAFAVACQVVDFLATGSLYQSILVTFSLSVVLVWLLQRARRKKTVVSWTLLGIGVAAVFFIAQLLPGILKNTDFSVDYGFLGVLLPVCIYACKSKTQKLLCAAGILSLIALESVYLQWFALLALPLLWLYNGSRGKLPMKWLFYLYYPVHLVVIQGVAYLLDCI